MKRRAVEQDVIVVSSDDESTRVPGRRVPREARAAPSREVVELRKQVAKLEKDFQGACLFYRKFELEKEQKQARIAFLEDLIDTKPPIDETDKQLVKSLQKKLDKSANELHEVKLGAARTEAELLERVNSLEKQLEREKSQANEEESSDDQMRNCDFLKVPSSEVLLLKLGKLEKKYEDANRRADEAQARVEALDKTGCEGVAAIEVEKMQKRVDDLQERWAESLMKLHEAERWKELTTKREFEKGQELLALKLEIVGMKKIIQKAEDERKSALEAALASQSRDRARIDELTRQLSDLQQQRKDMQPLDWPLPISPMPTCPPKAKESSPVTQSSTNLLVPCSDSDNSESISYEEASSALRAIDERMRKDVHWHFRYKDIVRRKFFNCAVCSLNGLTADSMVGHFIGVKHADKTKRGRVSRAAFNQWMRKLESAQYPTAVYS